MWQNVPFAIPPRNVNTPTLDSRSAGVLHSLSRSSEEFSSYSSDYELQYTMNSEISLSQEKMQELSFSESVDEETPSTPMMVMAEEFASLLTDKEKDQLTLRGIYSIDLTRPSPITIGRDEFFAVFGENIQGGMTFHLSRRHCLFHVTRTTAVDGSSPDQFKVVVENTSTNGIEVNGRPLKNGETEELSIGDTVTLLRIRNNSVSGDEFVHVWPWQLI